MKGKIYNKTIGNDSKFYLCWFNKLVDKWNKTYHHFIGKKPIDADYSALTEKIKSNHKVPKFKVRERVRITKYKSSFSSGYIENWSREIFVIDSLLNTNSWTYKIKDLNGERIVGRFYEK